MKGRRREDRGEPVGRKLDILEASLHELGCAVPEPDASLLDHVRTGIDCENREAAVNQSGREVPCAAADLEDGVPGHNARGAAGGIDDLVRVTPAVLGIRRRDLVEAQPKGAYLFGLAHGLQVRLREPRAKGDSRESGP